MGTCTAALVSATCSTSAKDTCSALALGYITCQCAEASRAASAANLMHRMDDSSSINQSALDSTSTRLREGSLQNRMCMALPSVTTIFPAGDERRVVVYPTVASQNSHAAGPPVLITRIRMRE